MKGEREQQVVLSKSIFLQKETETSEGVQSVFQGLSRLSTIDPFKHMKEHYGCKKRVGHQMVVL